MGQLDLTDPDKRKPFKFDFTNHQRPPKSPDPYAKYLASVSYADALRKDTTKQQNQNPSNSSRAPNINTAGSANGGSRAPNNTNAGGASGGSRAPNIKTGSGNGGSRASNTNTGGASGGSRTPHANTSGAVSANTLSLSPSSSSIQLQFGNLKYDPSLLNTSHIKFASNVKTSSPPQVTSSSSEAGISSTDIHKLQRLIKLAIAAGRLRSKCRKCGNSVQHCCEQTILEAVSSLPQPSNS